MFGFQIIKWFWNLWDHLLTITLFNVLSLLLLGGSFYLLQLLPGSFLNQWNPAVTTTLSFTLIFLGLFLLTVLQHAYALSNYAIAKYERSDWKDSLRRAWCKPSLSAALRLDLLAVLCSGIYYVSWRFYSQQSSILSLFAIGLLFWLALLFLLSFGYYFPMLIREDFAVIKALRQSFFVCLDNLFLTIGLTLVATILLAASFVPPLALFFGWAGLGLWYEVSLRILYYKYQYLQQLPKEELLQKNGKRQKVKIPWRVMLREERERIGPRSLRNFIFPWKD